MNIQTSNVRNRLRPLFEPPQLSCRTATAASGRQATLNAARLQGVSHSGFALHLSVCWPSPGLSPPLQWHTQRLRRSIRLFGSCVFPTRVCRGGRLPFSPVDVECCMCGKEYYPGLQARCPIQDGILNQQSFHLSEETPVFDYLSTWRATISQQVSGAFRECSLTAG